MHPHHPFIDRWLRPRSGTGKSPAGSGRRLALLGLALWAAVPVVFGQTPTELRPEPYAGLTITGEIDRVYAIEYVTELPAPTPTAWRCLEFLRLPVSPFLWIDRSAPATGQRFYRAVEFAEPPNMVFIPPGTFLMGSPTNEVDRWNHEGPQTAVTISHGFWIGQYEVTQRDYEAVTGSNPSAFRGDPDRPVESVTWFEANDYCAQLTQLERAAGWIPAGSLYRLPTEAEWEYACRAWTSTRFGYGDDPGYANLTEYAWYFGNRGSSTRQVGLKLPNPWGLFDMHGNVWEWCQDWLGDYPGGTVIDPQGPDAGTHRVFRGGGWSFSAFYCRSAHRWYFLPETRGNGLGLRVVLAAEQR